MSDVNDREATLEPVSEELQALFQAEKHRIGPSSETRERVLLRLIGTIGLAPAFISKARRTVRVGAGLPLGRVARFAAVVAILGAGAAMGAGGYHVIVRGKAASTPVIAPVSRPVRPPTRGETPPAPSSAPLQDRNAPSSSTSTSPARVEARSKAVIGVSNLPSDDGLAAERGLLELARTALVRGQADRAVATLRRHARSFPDGLLAEERDGLMVQALVGAREYDNARALGGRFKARYPRSLFAPVVDQALGSIP